MRKLNLNTIDKLNSISRIRWHKRSFMRSFHNNRLYFIWWPHWNVFQARSLLWMKSQWINVLISMIPPSHPVGPGNGSCPITAGWMLCELVGRFAFKLCLAQFRHLLCLRHSVTQHLFSLFDQAWGIVQCMSCSTRYPWQPLTYRSVYSGLSVS